MIYRNGTNGRYTTFGGRKVSKWNNYNGINQEHRAKASTQGFYPAINVIPNYFTILGPNAQLRCISNLVTSVKGHDFNLGMALKESKTTMEMILNTASTLATSMRHLKRGNFSAAARALKVRPTEPVSKTIAGRWLELQYGWLPLLSDVEEGAKAMARIANPPRLKRYVGKISNKMVGDSSASPTNYTSTCFSYASMKYIYEAVEDISTPRHLGLLDPATIAWESIPYSFVIDWFIPIGDYLSTLNIAPNLKGRFLYVAYRNDEAVCNDPPPTSFYYQEAGASYTYVEEYREVLSSLVVPQPKFVPLDDVFSPKRFFNTLALARQAFK